MTENKELTFVFKQFFMLVLCVSPAAGLCSQPLKSTVSYISSLSETCVNTFTGERAEPVPSEPGQDEPGKPENPGNAESPPTGDYIQSEWYVFGMLVGLAGIAATVRSGRREIRFWK